MDSRLILLPLLKDYKASTNGSDTLFYVDLDVPAFKGLLALAESLTLLSLTVGAPGGNELEWNIGFLSGFDRGHQGNFTAIATSNITVDGSARSSAYTTVTNFNLDSRLQLMLKNKTSTSGVRSATISAVLLVQTIGT